MGIMNAIMSSGISTITASMRRSPSTSVLDHDAWAGIEVGSRGSRIGVPIGVLKRTDALVYWTQDARLNGYMAYKPEWILAQPSNL